MSRVGVRYGAWQPTPMMEAAVPIIPNDGLVAVALDVEYDGFLSELESTPQLEVSTSLDAAPGGVWQYNMLPLPSPSQSAVQTVLYVPPPPWRDDETVSFQAFATVRTASDNDTHVIPAGKAVFLLRDLLTAAQTQDLVRYALRAERRVAIRDLIKGRLIVGAATTAKAEFVPAGLYSMAPPARPFMDGLMRGVVAALSSPLRNEVLDTLGLSMQPLLPPLRRVRVLEFRNITDLLVPGYLYLGMYDMPDPDPVTMRQYFDMTFERRGWSEKRFVDAVLRLIDKKPLPAAGDMAGAQERFECIECMDIMAEALALPVNALKYVSDLAVVHRASGRATLITIENFDYSLKRGSSDCEDDNKTVTWMALWLRNRYRGGDASRSRGADNVLMAAQTLLQHYVLYSALLSVFGGKIADADGRKIESPMLDPALDDSVGAHMRCTFFPYMAAEKAIRSTYQRHAPAVADAAIAALRAANPRVRRLGAEAVESPNIQTLFLEGTGPMRALQRSYVDYYGPAMADAILESQRRAVQRLLAPDVVVEMHDAHLRGYEGKPHKVSFPRWFEGWVDRRANNKPTTLGRADTPNEFYQCEQTYFLVDDVEDIPVPGSSGAYLTLRHMTALSKERLRGSTPPADWYYGATVADVLSSDDGLGVMLHPGLSEPAREAAEVFKRHIPHAAPVRATISNNYRAECQRRFNELLDGLGAGLGDRRIIVTDIPLDMPWDADVQLVTRMRRLDSMDSYDTRGLGSALANNGFVQFVRLTLEFPYEGAAMVIVQFGVKISNLSP